ncbi:leucine-rich repeat-containing G-protein coupled receptor 4-like [Dreissena polymorpha]|uniref:leucine-rich repeat-containing G-protein coupled receptor 4-like n=1 Tax=Dreissena polymorpha TaxID=45954 RepID=UPI0022642AF4|nr:leucine-rich repeat-containing G-protein coupled receptor 4-like [Dreissena polymorpha]
MGVCMLTLIPLLIGATSSFLLDSSCSPGGVCACSNSDIQCNGKGLTDVPVFKIAAPISRLYLTNNSINILKNYAFISLQDYVSYPVELDFRNNNISVIENNSFQGLDDKVSLLQLDNNNLQVIPLAVANLSRIEYLLLMFNPIKTLDQNVLLRIGDSLKEISFSFELFQHWPTQLHVLFKLRALYVSKFNSTILRISDFHYMTQMLQFNTFELSNSRLEDFPVGICDLDHLSYLNLAYNSFSYRTRDFFGVCHTPKSNIKNVHMHGNNFDVLPDFGKTFPSLITLNFSHNSLRYIESELTPMSYLETFDLDFNKLVHFPSALSTLTRNLRTLRIRHNSIIDIGNMDLMTFSYLQEINLDGNPLEYIAAYAFSHNTALHTLTIASTQLITIPCALMSIGPSQRIAIDLSNNSIECDCKMGCLLNLNLSNFSFLGDPQCLQGNSFVEFITTVIKANVCHA